MDNIEQLRSRWQTLRTIRIALIFAAIICSGMDALAGGRGSFIGQVGFVCLFLLIVVGLWERSVRKKAGIEIPKRSNK
jgi:hypothetical protein